MQKGKWTGWEKHLILRAQAGEQVAFELLVDEHRQMLYGLAYRMLRDSEDAHDAVQDSFIKAFRALHLFQAGRPVLPWLQRICSNCCVDILRTRRNQPENIERHEFNLEDKSINIAGAAEQQVDGDLVQEAVRRLPDRYRAIITMRHFHHMEVCEIASALNKPEGTIKSWLFRARAKLRKDLQVALG